MAFIEPANKYPLALFLFPYQVGKKIRPESDLNFCMRLIAEISTVLHPQVLVRDLRGLVFLKCILEFVTQTQYPYSPTEADEARTITGQCLDRSREEHALKRDLKGSGRRGIVKVHGKEGVQAVQAGFGWSMVFWLFQEQISGLNKDKLVKNWQTRF